jgi:alkylation response protein AidB-like acyl-CoA dehydrogenase
MSMLLTEPQVDLEAIVKDLAAGPQASREARRLLDAPGAYDDKLWHRLSREMELVGLAVPESAGGAEAGYQTRGVVLTELGAGLVPSPYFATAVFAVDVLAQLEGAESRAVLGKLVTGAATATVAASEPGSAAWPTSGLVTEATQTADGWALTGRKILVVDGASADYLIVTARSATGALGFYLVEPQAAGLTRTASGGVDPSRPLATIAFAGTACTPLTTADAAGALERARDLASLALCAELVGLQRRSVEVAVDYAKARFQFGRAIGSFQAVKHRLADMYTRYELSLASVRRGNSIADGEDDGDLSVAASTAHAEIARYARWTANDAIHVHGGIGFTWEHDAHLYLRRAVASEGLLGSPDFYADRLAGLLKL